MDDKYITFRRAEFFQMIDQWSSRRTTVGQMMDDIDALTLPDAVIIRRQDYFASPAFAGYAASIVVAAKLTEDDKRRNELIAVADYFQRQSELAAEEGWKTPDV